MSIRDYIYLTAIVALAGFGLYLRMHLINEGEARAEAREVQAAQIQKAKDDRTAKGVTDGLNAEIAHLRELALQPVPTVRLCKNPRPHSPPAATDGGDARAAPGWDVSGVPEGTGTGPDIGPGLQHLAAAADLVSAHNRACVAWAKGEAK